MILQALHALYGRLKDDPAYAIAPEGYSLQKISFKVVLKPDGALFEMQDARQDGKSRQLKVLGYTKSSGSGLNPCFLWDNTGYMLGYKPDDPKPARTKETFEAFREKHLALEKEIGSSAYSCVCSFLKAWNPERTSEFPALKDLATGFGVFQILGETRFVHEDPAVDAWWRKENSGASESPSGQCLVTGQTLQIAQLHPMLKGVGAKAQTSLVSFNDKAYESYGKEDGFNAPVGEDAAREYTSALNAMLDGPMRRKHRFELGDATVVFWTDKPSKIEDVFAAFSSYGSTATLEDVQDETLLQKLDVFLAALRQGVEKYGDLGDLNGTKFHLLALSPNSARLSVRFFLQGTLRELVEKLRLHNADCSIVKQFGEGSKHPDPDFPPSWMLLSQTARDRKEIPPLLEGPLLRAMLTGCDYPEGLFQAVMRRIGVDVERRVTYLRACIVRGYLNRNLKKEVSMSLNKERKEPAYRLGRLFAVLEKTQEDALGSVGSSVKDRFYGSASATPAVVFPRILRNYQHHLGKLAHPGAKVNIEKLTQEILAPLESFPAHLGLAEQGLFALGYYHQRQDLFTSKQDSKNANENAN